MSISPVRAGGLRPLAGVPHDLYRLARRFRQARWADLLGRPRHEGFIYEGRFPIPPERVLLLGGTPAVEPGRVEPYLEAFHGAMRPAKLHAIVDLMARLAGQYDDALCERWTTGLLRREAIGTCGIGNGFGLAHQFQSRQPIAVAQPPVDWWLILCPDGIEWEALDGRPVFGLFAHVFADLDQPGLQLRVYEKSCRLAREMDWSALARRPPAEAAATVNRRLLELTV